MSTQELKPVDEMTPQEFRRQIAGLCSVDKKANPDNCQDVAVRLAVILARHYNRTALDPLKLWNRIETALKTGVVKSKNSKAIISSMMQHVNADPANVGRDKEVRELMEDMESRGKQWTEEFAEYVRTTIYAVMVYAREEWQKQKKSKYGRKSVEDEAAAREAGEWYSDFFEESKVRQCMIQRAENRGEDAPDGMTLAEHLFGKEEESNG